MPAAAVWSIVTFGLGSDKKRTLAPHGATRFAASVSAQCAQTVPKVVLWWPCAPYLTLAILHLEPSGQVECPGWLAWRGPWALGLPLSARPARRQFTGLQLRNPMRPITGAASSLYPNFR